MRRLLILWITLTLCLFGAWQAQSQFIGQGVWRTVPSATGCAESTSFIARTSGMDTTHQTAFSTLICSLVSNGVWAKLDVLYVFATNSSANALLNLKSSSYAGTANGSPTFTADAGFLGVDASGTVYIDTGFNPNTASGNYAANSKSLSAWSNTNAASSAGGGAVIGYFVSGLGAGTCNGAATTCLDGVYPDYSSTGSLYFLDATSADVANANSTGHYLVNKTGSNLVTGYKNATSAGSNNATANSPLESQNMYVLALGTNGGIGIAGGGYQIMAASIGGGLTAGNITVLCHDLNLYLTTIASVSSGIC